MWENRWPDAHRVNDANGRRGEKTKTFSLGEARVSPQLKPLLLAPRSSLPAPLLLAPRSPAPRSSLLAPSLCRLTQNVDPQGRRRHQSVCKLKALIITTMPPYSRRIHPLAAGWVKTPRSGTRVTTSTVITRIVTAALEAGGWKLEAGSWRLEAGSWRLEAGSWKPATSELVNRRRPWHTRLPAAPVFPLISQSIMWWLLLLLDIFHSSAADQMTQWFSW